MPFQSAPTNPRDAERLDGVLLLARTLHHLLNTPITLALGYAQMVAEDPAVSAASRADVDEMLRSIGEIATLVGHLPALWRIAEVDVGLEDGPLLDLGRSSKCLRLISPSPSASGQVPPRALPPACDP